VVEVAEVINRRYPKPSHLSDLNGYLPKTNFGVSLFPIQTIPLLACLLSILEVITAKQTNPYEPIQSHSPAGTRQTSEKYEGKVYPPYPHSQKGLAKLLG
jgi:hypothetical protein